MMSDNTESSVPKLVDFGLARAFDARENGRAGAFRLAVRQEEGRRVGNFGQTVARHLENADLVGRAEPVLDRTQDAELVPALAFEIEDGVDHVFDDARPGDLAVLGYMTHQNDRGSAAFGELALCIAGVRIYPTLKRALLKAGHCAVLPGTV